jgi:hypothetical protein
LTHQCRGNSFAAEQNLLIMKTLFSKSLAWITLSVIIFSFAPQPGGDTYKVFLDNKLITEQMVHVQSAIPAIPVSAEQRELSVYYNHCGKLGNSRSLSILDERKKELKNWKFATNASMKICVAELMLFKKNRTVKLVYTSTEIPDGILLASLQLAGTTATAQN